MARIINIFDVRKNAKCFVIERGSCYLYTRKISDNEYVVNLDNKQNFKYNKETFVDTYSTDLKISILSALRKMWQNLVDINISVQSQKIDRLTEEIFSIEKALKNEDSRNKGMFKLESVEEERIIETFCEYNNIALVHKSLLDSDEQEEEAIEEVIKEYSRYNDAVNAYVGSRTTQYIRKFY